MSEIKVEDYVRTNKGNIGKVIDIFVGHTIANYHIEFQTGVKVKRQYLSNKTIIKYSPNIIDLIEIGDYVNDYRVRGKTNEKVVVDYYCYSNELCDGCWLSFREEQIVSIVTKEQFKRMEYKV